MGRPRKEATEANIEVKDTPQVSVEVPISDGSKTEETKQKTVLEYLAEFSDKKVLQVPDEVLKKFPDMHFVWIYNDERRVSIKEGQGYELVHAPSVVAKRLGVKGYRTITDDLIKYGDLVLMMCPMNYYIARETKKEMDLQKMARQMAQSTALHNASKSSGLDIPVAGQFKVVRG